MYIIHKYIIHKMLIFCMKYVITKGKYIYNKRTSANSFSFSTCRTWTSFFAVANGDCVMCVGRGSWFFRGVFDWQDVYEQDADVEASSSSSSRITMLSITAPAIRKGGERICWGVTNVEVSGLHFNYTNTWKHTSYVLGFHYLCKCLSKQTSYIYSWWFGLSVTLPYISESDFLISQNLFQCILYLLV